MRTNLTTVYEDRIFDRRYRRSQQLAASATTEVSTASQLVGAFNSFSSRRRTAAETTRELQPTKSAPMSRAVVLGPRLYRPESDARRGLKRATADRLPLLSTSRNESAESCSGTITRRINFQIVCPAGGTTAKGVRESRRRPFDCIRRMRNQLPASELPPGLPSLISSWRP
jgi:hypothetical protein